MTLDLTAMRRLLRKGLGGLDATDLPNSETDELLNLSLWELESQFPFRAKVKTVVGVFVVNVATVTVPAPNDSLISIAVIDLEGKRHKLSRRSRHWYDEEADPVNDKGLPRRYFREKETITVHPTPDAAYSREITMKETVASLLDPGNLVTGLPRNWDEIVVEGAITRGHFYVQDYLLARQAENFRLGKIRSAILTQSKEEKEDSRYARLNVIWDDPEDA